jgi:hypothetical protein
MDQTPTSAADGEQMSWDIVIKNVATGEVQQITKNKGMDVDAS